MIRFLDSFDHYGTGEMLQKWTSRAGSTTPAIVPAGGVGGTQSLRVIRSSSNAGSVVKTLSPHASWVVGFNFRVSAAPVGGPISILALLDASSVQVDLRLNSDMTLSATRAGGTLVGGTSTASLQVGIYAFVEFKVTIANAIGAGTCVVRLNTVDVITVAAAQDTQATANASSNGISLLTGINHGSNQYTEFDDLYVCDGTVSGIPGRPNNDFLGDCRVEAIYPTGAGATSGWTPSAGANWQCVDETSPNADVDYVAAEAAGAVDSYAMANLSTAPASIFGVQGVLMARKDDAGSRSVAPLLRSGGVDSPGATTSVGDGYNGLLHVWNGDPDGSVAWTAAGVNAVEAGVKLIS